MEIDPKKTEARINEISECLMKQDMYLYDVMLDYDCSLRADYQTPTFSAEDKCELVGFIHRLKEANILIFEAVKVLDKAKEYKYEVITKMNKEKV